MGGIFRTRTELDSAKERGEISGKEHLDLSKYFEPAAVIDHVQGIVDSRVAARQKAQHEGLVRANQTGEEIVADLRAIQADAATGPTPDLGDKIAELMKTQNSADIREQLK
jgi:hypothetical protein